MRIHYRIPSEREDDAAIRVEESLAAAFPLGALDLDARDAGDWLLDGASGRVALVADLEAGALPADEATSLREHLAPAASRTDDRRLTQRRARLEGSLADASGEYDDLPARLDAVDDTSRPSGRTAGRSNGRARSR